MSAGGDIAKRGGGSSVPILRLPSTGSGTRSESVEVEEGEHREKGGECRLQKEEEVLVRDMLALGSRK
jgi:hypothetical protein